MKYKKSNGAFSSLLILVVLSIFAISSLLLVMIGANTYKNIVKDTDRNNQIRASLSYVANKVRQNDELGAITVETKEETQVLAINTAFGGKPYCTYIYFYNGAIYESFLAKDKEFKLTEGSKVVSVEKFKIDKNGKSLSLKANIIDTDALELKLT